MAYPSIAPGDRYEIVVLGSVFGQATMTTFHYHAAAVVGDQHIDDIHTNFNVHFSDEFPACCSLDWNGHTITVRRVAPNPTRAIPFVIEWPGTVDAGGTLPPSTCAVISRVSWDAGRASLGRVFMPAVPTEWHDDGKIVPPGGVAYTAMATKMAANITEGVNLILEPVLLGPTNVARKVEHAFYRPVLRQQRRREIGVGI